MQLPARFVTSLLLVLFGFTFILSASLPTVEIGKWSPGPDLTRPLANASAVLLSDGSLFFSGGTSTDGPVASAQVFSGGAFASAGSMNVARANHASIVLQDGRVLVTGGTTASGATNQAEIYDPADGSWSAAGNLLDARSGHTASLLHDGRVLIAGGSGSAGPISSLEVYDPDTNSFTSAGALAAARADLAAVVLSDGHVLIIGGSDGSQALASTEIFNSADSSVSAGPTLSTPRAKASATTLLDGRIAVIGGNNGSVDLSSAEIYSSGSFSPVSDNLAQARSGHMAFLLPHNNSVLIVGGSAASNDLASAELFAPWIGSSGSFSTTGSLSSPRNGSIGGPLDIDGLLIVAGGNNSASSELYGFATLKTDADDYAVGSPVHITGKGWQPGETVTLSFVESPNIDQHPAIQTIADSNGNISDSSFSPDNYDIDVRFYLTATGSVSSAQITFTDSKPNAVTLNPTSVTVSPGGTATYAVTIAFNGNNTPCTSPLSVTGGLPAGAVASFSPSSVTTPDGSSQTSTLTITTTAATPTGTNTITVLAGNGAGCQAGTATGSGTLMVVARRVASVSVGAQTGTLISNTAGSATYAVTVTRGASGPFSANLSLTTALPTGATASFSPSTVSFAASDTTKTSTLTISSTAATPPGSTTFTAQAANPAAPGDSATGNGTLLIGNATQTITFGALANKTYGDAPFTVSATGGASGNPVTFSSTTLPVCTTSGTNGSTVTIVAAGTCTIKASQAGNATYNAAADVNQSFTVAKATLTVTADNKSRNYGDANPSFTVSYSGFVNSETLATSGVTGTPSATTTATPPSSIAGSPYAITATIGTLASTNYAFSFVNGQLTINKAVLTVTAADATREYGDANPAVTATYTGFKNGETLATSGVTGTPSTSSAATPASSVAGSPYAITIAIGSLASVNYSFVFVDGNLTITKAALTVTATDISREYGDANPAVTATYTGFKNGESLATSGVTGTPGTSTTATPASSVAGSPYPITVTIGTLASANYSFVFAEGKLSITPAPLSVTPGNATREYGDTNPAFTGTITGIKNSDNITASYASAATTASSVAGSPYDITATVNDPDHKLPNYNLTSNVGHLTISPAPLTVTPANASRLYGAANPAFTGNIIGIKNSDNITATYSSAATPGSSVAGSPYDITATLVDPDHKLVNYTASSNVGHLTISPAPLSVKADDKSRTYGAANPSFTGVLTGVVNSDNISASYSTLATAASNVGTYAITPALADPDHRLGNYDVTNTDGTLVIIKAALSVKADDKSRTYGAVNPAFTGTLLGVVNSDNITATYSTIATAASNVGSYPITPALSDPDSRLANYDVTNTDGTLLISKAALSVKAEDKSRPYGAANPALTGVLTGVVNSDNITATYSTLAVVGSNVGTYAITPALADPDHRLGNYDLTSTDGTLIISKVALSVTADDKSRTYGVVNPALTGVLTGVVNSDNIAATYSTTATAASNIGTYAITPALADPDHRLGNYDVASTNGVLTISKAPLSAKADDKSRTYGAVNPALTGLITGVVNGDNITASYSTSAVTGSNIGSYPISPSLADPDHRLGNYDLTSTDGTLLISKAPLSVIADSKSRNYGVANPAFTGILSGVVNSDNITATYASAATASSNVGTYPVTPTLLDPSSRLGNYDVTSTNGVLTINAALLTITANNQSKIYNAANPALTAGYSGFVLSQSPADLTGTLSCSTSALLNSLVGSYPINCSGQTSTNYAITYLPGTLNILYSTLACAGSAGHTILQPINPNGSSVFKQGSTTPAKFRVCDANGASIGLAGVVSSFKIIAIRAGLVTQSVNEDPVSTTPDDAFRWDPSDQQWIYNIKTKSLNANSTYTFAITLNDGSTIPFMYGLK